MLRNALLPALLIATIPATGQSLSPADSAAITRAIVNRIEAIGDATGALDIDRLVALHEQSKSLTYVAGGRVTRGIDAFRKILEEQLGGLSSAEVRFDHVSVQVLDRNVAVSTSTYELVAALPTGSRVTGSGTYTCVFVRTGDNWLIHHSSHTVPR